MYIKLLDTDTKIANDILNELVIILNKHLQNHIKSIEKRIKEATFLYLQSTDTYNSLVYGNLAIHFGIPIPNRQNNIDKIIKAVADGIRVEFKPIKYTAGKFTNGIKIFILRKDLSEVLNLASGIVISERGEALEWLKWLLTKGDTIIIREYDVEFMPGEGRSGGGIMIEDKAGVWRVPPEYSGTLRNNWLTRALNENATPFLSIIQNIIKSEL